MDISKKAVDLEVLQEHGPENIVDLLMDEVERLQTENATLLTQLLVHSHSNSSLGGVVVGAGEGVRLLRVKNRVVRLVGPLNLT
ncbi:MAG: hypothetical protein EpisKO_15750 [Epibacterium sp.]